VKKNILYVILFSILLYVVPLVFSDYGVNLIAEIFIMGIFAMSLGLIMGYSGMVSLGHAAFYGIGAYTVALAGKYITNTYLLILLAILLAGFIALLTGAIFIRTSKFYFLMITLAFAQLIYALFWQLKDLTGGADGKSVSSVMNFGFGDIVDPKLMYYVMGIAFLAAFILLRLFVGSPAGKMIKGVMENESRMRALGYNIRVYKLLAYSLSGAMAGLAGALYAYFNAFVTPDLSGWLLSGQLMMMVIIGGVGTLVGPAIGAGLYIFLQNFISTYTERWPLIMGILIVLLVLVGKGGIIHWVYLLKAKLFNRKRKNVKKSPQTSIEKKEVAQ
jgi:branched-chain amino acid transport system permease protein